MVFQSLRQLAHTHTQIRYNFPALHVEIYRLPLPWAMSLHGAPLSFFSFPPPPLQIIIAQSLNSLVAVRLAFLSDCDEFLYAL